MSEAVTLVFLPTGRCQARGCNAAYVGIDARCAPCQRKLNERRHATLQDIIAHKRASVRKRLGLEGVP